jgi:hypothetical protein
MMPGVEIKDRQKLEQIISNLKQKKEIKIDIPDMYDFEIIDLCRKHKISCSRVGFKKWSLSPTITIVEKKINSGIVIFRAICLISTFILLIFFIYWVASPFWRHLESYFSSLPLLSGIVSGLVAGLITMLIGIHVYKIGMLLRSYLVN